MFSTLKRKTYFFIVLVSVFLAVSSYLSFYKYFQDPKDVLYAAVIYAFYAVSLMVLLFLHLDWNIFYRLRRVSGRIRVIIDGDNFKERLVPFVAGDEIGKLVGTVNELFEHIQQCREKYAKSVSEYKSLVEDMPAIVYRFLPDGTVTYVNESYCKLFLEERNNRVYFNIFEHMPQEQHSMFRKSFLSINQERDTSTVVHQIVLEDGSTKWLRGVHKGIFDEHGRLLEYQGIGVDITEQRLMEQELQAQKELEIEQEFQLSENKYLTLFNSVSDALFLVDFSTGLILDVNKSACNLCDSSSDQLKGRVFKRLFLDNNTLFSEGFELNVEKLVGGYYKKINGSLLPVEIKIDPLVGYDQVVASVRDVSYR